MKKFFRVTSFRYALESSLVVVLLLFGLFTILTTATTVVQTYSPAYFGDQWQIINTLLLTHDRPTLASLWAQHNEHRIVTGRILSFADLFFFKGRNVSLFAEIFVFQILHLFVLAFLVRKFGCLSRNAYWSLVAFVTYCLFSPLQIENFIWAFQVVFILANLFATLCFASALWYASQSCHKSARRRTAAFLLSLLFAFLAESSEAHGLLTWPILILLSFTLNFRLRDRWITGVCALGSLLLYGIGYKQQSPPGSFSSALSRPSALLRFVLTYLGNSWSPNLPNSSAWPTVIESLTLLIALGTVALAAYTVWRRSLLSPLQQFLLGNLLFGLGTACITAVGRIGLGMNMALSSRYQTPALVFWACLVTLLAVSFPGTTTRFLATAQVLLLLFMMAGAIRWTASGRFAIQRQYLLEQGWNAAVQNQLAGPYVSQLFYDTDMLKTFVQHMRSHNWGAAGQIKSFAKLRPLAGRVQLKGFKSTPQDCTGEITLADRSGLTAVLLSGWAEGHFAGDSRAKLVVASEAGDVIASADISHPPNGTRASWQTTVAFTQHGEYRVFLVSLETHSACAFQNQLHIRQLPDF